MSPGRMAPAVAAYVFAGLAAAGVGHFLLGIPIQLTDSFNNMLKLEAPWREFMVQEFTSRAYFRPFLWGELKAVYDLSGGNYFPWFRGVHVAQVFGVALLFVALVRPRTWRDAALVPLGLAVLLGIHTFRGAIFEAFPINTFLTVLLCCMAAAVLALMTHRWWVDLLAVFVFVIAALTVESGLLAGVVIIGAALVGAKGISRPGVTAIAVLLVGYFVLRFVVLDVGSPGLSERSSGYGFRILDPDDIIARFGESPYWFYAYNVGTSALSVLFSEPRAGVFGLVYGFAIGDPYPPAIINVIASTAATALIVAYGWRRRRLWRARQFDHDDRLVVLFVIVLGANAVISYPYTKDVIMSPAGAFFAAAVFAAARGMLADASISAPSRAGAAAVALCAVLGTAWAIRLAAVPLGLRETARKVRVEWAYAHDWLADQNITLQHPREQALLQQLRDDAIYRYPAPPRMPLADHWLLDLD